PREGGAAAARNRLAGLEPDAAIANRRPAAAGRRFSYALAREELRDETQQVAALEDDEIGHVHALLRHDREAAIRGAVRGPDALARREAQRVERIFESLRMPEGDRHQRVNRDALAGLNREAEFLREDDGDVVRIDEDEPALRAMPRHRI